jgi:WD40 repeat protein
MTRASRTRHSAPWIVILFSLALVAVPSAAIAKHFSEWGSPVLETAVNDPSYADGCPIESPNGLDLYIASTRPGAVGGATDANDIWVAHRSSIDSAWSAPEHLPPPVNSAAADFCPTPLSGKGLLFVSTRMVPGACGAGDIYLTRNNPAHGWEMPMNLGCSATGAGPNFAGGEFSPSLVETDQGTLLFFSSGLAGADQNIYVSVRRSDGSFGPATAVAELNTGANDQMPNVRRDGLEMVFVSDRSGGVGGLDIYVTTRASTADAWSAPINLGPSVNLSANESRPSLSGDGERLHFGRGGEIWVSPRTRIAGGD